VHVSEIKRDLCQHKVGSSSLNLPANSQRIHLLRHHVEMELGPEGRRTISRDSWSDEIMLDKSEAYDEYLDWCTESHEYQDWINPDKTSSLRLYVVLENLERRMELIRRVETQNIGDSASTATRCIKFLPRIMNVKSRLRKTLFRFERDNKFFLHIIASLTFQMLHNNPAVERVDQRLLLSPGNWKWAQEERNASGLSNRLKELSHHLQLLLLDLIRNSSFDTVILCDPSDRKTFEECLILLWDDTSLGGKLRMLVVVERGLPGLNPQEERKSKSARHYKLILTPTLTQN
jgi:hypothetical protein